MTDLINDVKYHNYLNIRLVAIVLVLHFCCLVTVFIRDSDLMLMDDNQIGTMPTCMEMGRQLWRGEIPLVNNNSWHASGIAGEYTPAFFHPPMWIFCMLVSLKLFAYEIYALIWIEWSYLILLTGTFLLAKEFKLSPQVSAMVTMMMGSSGYLAALSPAWFVVLQSFAYLPWCWWAIHRACSSNSWKICLSRASMAGILLGMLITSGWTFTDFMALIIYFFVYVQFILLRNFWRPTLACLVSGLLGLGLSSPSWLMLIEYSTWSYRVTQQTATYTSNMSLFHFQDYLNLIYPITGYYLGNLNCAMVSNGSIATLLVLWGVISNPRILYREWSLFLLMSFVFMLCMIKDVPPFRWNFRFLPLLHLVICLMSGIIVQKYATVFRLSKTRIIYQTLIFILMCVSLIFLAKWKLLQLFFTLPIPTWYPIIWGSLILLTGFIAFNSAASFMNLRGWGVYELNRNLMSSQPQKELTSVSHIKTISFGLTSLLITTTTMLAYTPAWGFRIKTPKVLDDKGICTNPTWYYSNYSPDDPEINSKFHRFFPGGMNNNAGIRTINGYSTMAPVSTTGMFNIGDIGYDFTPEVIIHENFNCSALLKWMAIDGLILNPANIPRDIPPNEFEKIGIQDGYEIWHRIGGPSALFSTHKNCVRGHSLAYIVDFMMRYNKSICALDDPAEQNQNNVISDVQLDPFKSVELCAKNSSQMVFDVDTVGNSKSSLITIARPWLPGYKASLNGITVKLLRANTLMPAVMLEKGQKGKLIIEYKPDSWIYGWYISIGSLLISLALIYTCHKPLTPNKLISQ